jgi:actin, other eukaryote
MTAPADFPPDSYGGAVLRHLVKNYAPGSKEDLYPPIVVCGGRHTLSAGFAGDECPRTVFPPLIGRPRVVGPSGLHEKYVGDEAVAKRSILAPLRSPFDPTSGVIENFDDWEAIMHHTFFDELRSEPSEHPVLLAEPCMNPEATRAKMFEILFERFHTPACFLEMDARLVLLCSGRTQGLVVDAGHGRVRCSSFCASRPVDGMPDGHYPELMAPPSLCGVGGAELAEELIFRLEETGGWSGAAMLRTAAERDVCRHVLERLCRISSGGAAEEKQYELPDGTVIRCTEEHLSTPDVLFDTSLQRRGTAADGLGLADAVANAAIAAADADVAYSNVVLCGGTSLTPGLGAKLMEELRRRHGGKVSVITPVDRKYSAWIGGSALALTSPMDNLWISQDLYDEEGPQIVNRQWPGGATQFSSGSHTKAARG